MLKLAWDCFRPIRLALRLTLSVTIDLLRPTPEIMMQVIHNSPDQVRIFVLLLDKQEE